MSRNLVILTYFVILCWKYSVAVDSTPGHTSTHSLASECPSKIGPTHGAVVRWTTRKNASFAVPTNKVNCWVTLQGKSAPTNVNQYAVGVPEVVTSFKFRTFKINGWNAEIDSQFGGCKTAYVEVFNIDESNKVVQPRVYEACGTTKPAEFISTTTSIKFHLVVATNPGHNSSALPDIEFVADFTTFYYGNCTDDTSMVACNNSRCIDRSLACDNNKAQNCGDGSDESFDAPAYCPIPPPSSAIDEVALYSTLGALASLSLLPLLYWCCWRPGWFPWRVCRCRQCCRNPYGPRPSAAEKERASRFQSVYGMEGGGPGGPGGASCCGGCLGGGRGGGGSGGASSFGKGGFGKGGSMFNPGYSSGPGMFGGGGAVEPWWQYAQQDGGHIRECR